MGMEMRFIVGRICGLISLEGNNFLPIFGRIWNLRGGCSCCEHWPEVGWFVLKEALGSTCPCLLTKAVSPRFVYIFWSVTMTHLSSALKNSNIPIRITLCVRFGVAEWTNSRKGLCAKTFGRVCWKRHHSKKSCSIGRWLYWLYMV